MGAKIHAHDWSESALLRFWHVGHKVGGTLTPDAALAESHAAAVLHRRMIYCRPRGRWLVDSLLPKSPLLAVLKDV